MNQDETNITIAAEQPRNLEYLASATRSAVERATIAVLPDPGFGEYEGPVFPQGTVDFLHFLRERAPTDVSIALAGEDADYKEVLLHSDIVRLATIVVTYAAAPIASSLIAAYLKDWLGSRFNRAETRTSIVVHRKEAGVEQTVRISYAGPASNAEQAMRDAIKNLPLSTPTAAKPATVRSPQPGKKQGRNDH
jgi:hypothetical protein